MEQDGEFNQRLNGYSYVTINVLYYMPDHRSLVNEFIWQTLDLKPRYPRVEKFLNYWRQEIDAVIKEVLLCDGSHFEPTKYSRITDILQIH